MDEYERLDAVEELISTVKLAISEAESCHSSDVEEAKAFLDCTLGTLHMASIELMRKVNKLQMRERSLEAAEYARSR